MLRMASEDALNLVQKSIAELLGTTLLIFFSCMGIQSNTNNQYSSLHAGASYGFTVAMCVMIFKPLCGSHLNPAVTIASFVMGRITILNAGIYILVQLIGGIFGYLLLDAITANSGIPLACATVPDPHVSELNIVWIEFLTTGALIFCFCTVWKSGSEPDPFAPIKLGLVVFLLASVETPYSHCSMNPAKSFGSALLGNNWNAHWVYWVGPMAAGLFVPAFYRINFTEDLDCFGFFSSSKSTEG